MIVISHILLFLSLILQVIMPMSFSHFGNFLQDEQSASDNGPVVADSLYSAKTHDSYMQRFQPGISRADSTALWNSLLGVDTWESVDLYKNLRDDIHVLGWHPYWAEDASLMYDYETLSMISYFGYSFNSADGSGINPGRWRSTMVMERAHNIKKSVQILLTVYSYDAASNEEFFNNPDAMIRLVDDVTKLIDEKGGHGVTLDFQNISPEDSSSYVALVQQFSEQMAPKKQLVTIVIPAVDPNKTIAVNQMTGFLDYVIMMGYDFHGEGKKPGPMSVLYEIPGGESPSIESSVNRLWNEGAGVPKEKILVSLGWIGARYNQTREQETSPEYVSIGSLKSTIASANFDSSKTSSVLLEDFQSSRSNKLKFADEITSDTLMYYFLDTSNFGLNLDWIQKDSLAGVAIWTLADAGNGDDYWAMIAEYFGRPPPSIMTYVLIPLWDFIVDEWLNPFLSLFLSIVIASLFLIVGIYVSYKKNVPDWLQKLGIFLPLIILFIMVFSLSHDLLAHYVVDRWDDPVKTTLSLVFGSLLLLIALWYCIRVYYLDRRRVP